MSKAFACDACGAHVTATDLPGEAFGFSMEWVLWPLGVLALVGVVAAIGFEWWAP